MIEINLLPEELGVKTRRKKISVGREASYFLYFVIFTFGLLVCIHIYLAFVSITKNSQLAILNSKWKLLEPQRKTLEAFFKEYAVYLEDTKVIDKFIKERINWSEKLNKLSLALPSGVWFNELSISSKEFILSGSVVSLQKEEISLIKKLIDNLKNDTGFFKNFNNLELTSTQRKTIGGYDTVDFVLVAALKSK